MADAQDTETNINNDEVPVAETTAWDAQSTIRTKEEKNEINAKTGEISEGDGTSPNLHTGTRDDGETAASSSFDEGSAGLFSNEHDAPTETVDAGAADAASQDDHDNAQDAALNQTTASLDMDAASDASDETETTAGASVVTPPEAASTQEQTASASPDQTAPEPAAPQETSTTTDTADTTDTAASTLDVQNDDPSQDDQTTQDTAASPTSTAEETNDPALNAGDDTLSEASPAETVDAGAADAASQDDHDNAQDAALNQTTASLDMDAASDASDETETTAGASVVTPPEAASTQEQTASASPDQTAPEPAAPQETSTTTDTADTTDTAASTLDVQNDDLSQDDQAAQDTAASPTSTAEETNDPALNAGDDTLSEASPAETVDAGAADAASQDDHDNAQDAALNQTTASLDMDAASDASDETETTTGAAVETPPEAASTQEQTASASPDQTAPEPAAPQETSTTTDTAASTLDVQNDDPSQDDQTTQDTAASPTSTAEETNDPALNAGDDTLSEASPAETVDAGAADAASQDDHDNAQDAPLQETLVPDSLDSAPPTLLLDPDRPEMPLDAPVPGDTVALVVTLAGEAYKGNPDYEIVVDGEVVSTGSVDWSRETTSEGRYQTGDEIDWRDVSIDLVMPEGGFGQVEVRFPNDAYQADIGDRNLLVDKISLNGFEMEAEADETAYQGGNYADGASAERMPWSGTLEFDTSSVFENAEPLEAPEGAYILEGDAGAVIGTLSLDETSLENGSEVTVSDDRFEVIDGKLKLRDDIMLDFEAEPSLVLDVSITNAQGQVSSSQFEVAVANDPNYDTSVVTGTLETKFQAKYFDVSTSIKTLDDIGWDGASTFEESIDTIDYTKSSDSFWEGGSENTFGAQITGQIDVPEDGTFTFTLGADDGAVLYIDGVPIIDNDGLHAFKEESVDIQLEPGAHAIEVRYFENYGQAGLKLEWDGPGVDGPTLLTPAPADSLNGIEGVPLVFEVDLNLTESLETVQLDGLPAGTIISAGDQITTVGEDPVDLDNWDLSQISVTPPIGFTGSISAEITAEDVHGKRAAVDLEVDVQEAPIDLASAGVKAGFHVEFFEEDHKLTRMSDVDFDAEPAAEGIYSTLEFEKSSGSFHEDVAKDRFAVRATGDFEVEEGGVYDFQVGADDGAVLFINGVEVVENDGLHGFRDREGSVELEPGTHEIELRYFENTGKAGLNLQFKGPDTDGAYEPVEASSELAANADGQLSFAVDLGGLNDVSSVSLSGLPTGTWISAGDQNALVTDETTDITDWDLDALAIDVPEGFSADVEVQLDATGTLFNGAQKTLSQSFTIENQGTEEGSGIENEIEWPDEGPSAWDQNTSDTQEHEFDLSETNIDIEEQQTEVEYAHSSIDF